MIDTLWFTRCPAPTPASIAIRNAWLRDEFAPDGIEVLSLAASKDKSVHLSHYRHTQPNSFRFGGYVPPLISCARGRDVKIIGLLAGPNGGNRRPGGFEHPHGRRS